MSASVVADGQTAPESHLYQLECQSEAAIGIREACFGELENELPGDVVALVNGRPGLYEYGARFFSRPAVTRL